MKNIVQRGRIQFLSLLLFFVISSKALGQQVLKAGDKLPDLVLENVFNSPASSISTKDLRGKYVILDLWGTGCKSCIDGFSKLDTLQVLFKDRLEIIAVNKESFDSTRRFFERMKKIKIPDIPFVTGDAIIRKLFPTKAVPLHIWIDDKGIVQHISEVSFTTKANVGRFIEGRVDKFVEVDLLKDIPIGAPIFEFTEADSMLAYSSLSRWIPGQRRTHSAFVRRRNGKISRIVQRGAPLLYLYKYAVENSMGLEFYAANQISLEVRDSSKLISPADFEERTFWQSRNTFNYELAVPEELSGKLFEIMLEDISRLFGHRVSVEERKIQAVVLELNNSKGEKLSTTGGVPASNLTNADGDSVYFIKNRPFKLLGDLLKLNIKLNKSRIPFVNAVNLHINVDVVLNKESVIKMDISALNKELTRYGLTLVEQLWPIRVLVIRDRD